MTTSKSIGGDLGHGAPARRLDHLFKRILEVAAATTILLFFAPILLITVVAIRLNSRGPILIREARRDDRNRSIQVLKFRSVTAYGGGDWSSRRLTQVGLILKSNRHRPTSTTRQRPTRGNCSCRGTQVCTLTERGASAPAAFAFWRTFRPAHRKGAATKRSYKERSNS